MTVQLERQIYVQCTVVHTMIKVPSSLAVRNCTNPCSLTWRCLAHNSGVRRCIVAAVYSRRRSLLSHYFMFQAYGCASKCCRSLIPTSCSCIAPFCSLANILWSCFAICHRISCPMQMLFRMFFSLSSNEMANEVPCSVG